MKRSRRTRKTRVRVGRKKSTGKKVYGGDWFSSDKAAHDWLGRPSGISGHLQSIRKKRNTGERAEILLNDLRESMGLEPISPAMLEQGNPFRTKYEDGLDTSKQYEALIRSNAHRERMKKLPWWQRMKQSFKKKGRAENGNWDKGPFSIYTGQDS